MGPGLTSNAIQDNYHEWWTWMIYTKSVYFLQYWVKQPTSNPYSKYILGSPSSEWTYGLLFTRTTYQPSMDSSISFRSNWAFYKFTGSWSGRALIFKKDFATLSADKSDSDLFGDVNGDGDVDIMDIIVVVNVILYGDYEDEVMDQVTN